MTKKRQPPKINPPGSDGTESEAVLRPELSLNIGPDTAEKPDLETAGEPADAQFGKAHKKSEKPATKPRSVGRRLATYFIRLTIVLMVMLGGLAGALIYWVENQGGLATTLEKRLSVPERGIVFKLDKVDWHIEAGARPLHLHFGQAQLSVGPQEITLPEMSLSFGLVSLFTGGYPEVALVKNLSVALSHSADGWGIQTGKTDMGWLFGADEPDLRRYYNLLQQVGLRRVIIQDAKLHFENHTKSSDTGRSLKLEDIHIDLDASDLTALQLVVSMNQIKEEVHAKAGHLKLMMSGNLLSGLWSVQTRGQSLALAILSDFVPASFQKLLAAQRISPHLDASFDATKLMIATGALDIQDGRLPLPGVSAEQDRFKQLQFQFDYSRQDDLLSISEAQLLLPDGRSLSLQGQVADLHRQESFVSGSVLAEDISLDSILRDWPENAQPAWRSWLDQSLSAGAFPTLMLDFSGRFDKLERRLVLSQLDTRGEFKSVRFRLSEGQYQEFVGTVAGTMDLRIGAGGQIARGNLDASMKNAYVVAKGSDKPIKLDEGRLSLRFEPGQLHLDELFAQFEEGGALMLKAHQIADNKTNTDSAGNDNAAPAPLPVKASLTSDKIDLDILKLLWPEQVIPSTANWIKRRFGRGQISNARFDLTLNPAATGRDIVQSLQGALDLRDASFSWRDNSPEIQDVSGQVSMADNILSFKLDTASLPDVTADSAQITLSPMIAPRGTGRDLTINARLSGDVLATKALLAHPSVQKWPEQANSFVLESGALTAQIASQSRLVQNKLTLTGLQADTTLSDLAVASLPFDTRLDKGELALSVGEDGLHIEGLGLIDSVPASFSFHQQDDGERRLSMRLQPAEAVTKRLASYAKIDMVGRSGLRLDYVEQAETSTRNRSSEKGISRHVQIEADLSQTGIDVPAIDWAKLPGEAASARFLMRFSNDQLSSIEAIDLNMGSLMARGRLSFDDEGQIASGYFDEVLTPGNELSAVLVERQTDGVFEITAEGRRLNLRPLRRNEGLSKGQALRFDLTADQLLVDQAITLSGHLKGETKSDGNGVVTLQGSLSVNGKPLLSEGTIEAHFGPSGEHLSGVGLIGGGEARLRFTPDGEESLLIITSANAGRVLAGLGVTDTIREGRLRLVNRFTSKDMKDFETVIQLEEFNVIEAPAAVRAFSVLSVAGLYSLVEGDGTRFTRGEARIRTEKGLHYLDKLRASGGAVGVTMVGVYDRANRQVDVSGNLVPVNQFSKILGAVPVLGELLTGLDKAGLFATQFSVKGSVDEPEISVNAASLVPGVLRDLFSPDWLGSETNRILGDTDNSSKSQF